MKITYRIALQSILLEPFLQLLLHGILENVGVNILGCAAHLCFSVLKTAIGLFASEILVHM
ncbi:MAG: hypothetical protein ACXITV_13145 [Luteibaculaceae bacterium]